MKEISLNILDIAENSVRAGACNIRISLTEDGGVLTIMIEDDGCGMDQEMLARVENPFTTTRTTRAVGLGIPLYKLAAEQTGGSVTMRSVSEKDDPKRHGTTITAVFHTGHIDCMPLGDIISTVCTLIQGAPRIDFCFTHLLHGQEVRLDTTEIRAVLGDDIPIDSFEVMDWIRKNLEAQYTEINDNHKKGTLL